MDNINISSITATEYKQNIDNSTDNDYCTIVYNIPSNPDIEFASAIIQRAEILNIMGSVGSVTKNDTPCGLFSNPIIGQLEEREGHICDIMGSEAVDQGKVNISTVQANAGKGFNKIQLSKIWVISKEFVGKAINKKSQLCKHHADNSSY